MKKIYCDLCNKQIQMYHIVDIDGVELETCEECHNGIREKIREIIEENNKRKK